MCVKGRASIDDVYNPNRILFPLKRRGKRGSNSWERLSWDEALDMIFDKIKEVLDKHGPDAIAVLQGTGRGYNRYSFRFARSIGTPNFGLPTHVCYEPRLAVFGMMVGDRLYYNYHGWGGVYTKKQIPWGKQLEINIGFRVLSAGRRYDYQHFALTTLNPAVLSCITIGIQLSRSVISSVIIRT